MALEFSDWIALIISSSAVATIVASLLHHYFGIQELKQKERIAYLKERLDEFYSPLLFHFKNMKSWGEWESPRTRIYAFSNQELIRKSGDMYEIMRAKMRLSSLTVRELWFEWQPIATSPRPWPQSIQDEFDKRSQKLHEALEDEYKDLKEKYLKELGNAEND